jgi:hypothetical protein
VIFFLMALLLGYLQDQLHKQGSSSAFEKQVEQKQMQTPVAPPSSPLPGVSQPTPTANPNLLSVPVTPGNVPAATSTNPPASSPQSK